VSKIFSADWQAGFLGIAGNVEIDFFGGNDQRAEDRLSKVTKRQLRRFDLSKADSPWPDSPLPIVSLSLSHCSLTLPALYLLTHTSNTTNAA
jgi:hypothetical protein